MIEFEMIEVASSNLNAIGYDAKTQTLRVHFNSGTIYDYYGVPKNMYDGLLHADSHGSYLHRHIKLGGFSYNKIS